MGAREAEEDARNRAALGAGGNALNEGPITISILRSLWQATRGAEVSKLVAFLRLKFEMPTVAKDRHIPHGGSDKDHDTEFQKPPVLPAAALLA